ncbi:hypothetical protein A7979_03720 [Rothia nasimurium]|uniref:Uncharacterized protein n=1 Tax=Rothia nasimurium TaxID=85336 RepID=A0A1Y1RPQ0_9MICC|nr:hypothetical protein [Rothia nasimurium]ORC16440.1 hypothetical protein A7979_03720 [Rothia nasimurium]
MNGLRYDYLLLEELVSSFESARSKFETMVATTCPAADSVDPLAAHHVGALKAQEASLLIDAVTAYATGRDGAQAAYDAFKLADEQGAHSYEH